MNFCHWWVEQMPSEKTHSLLVAVIHLYDATVRKHGFGSPAIWRAYVDRLHDLLQQAPGLTDEEKTLIWQDSYDIRAIPCGSRHAYCPPSKTTKTPAAADSLVWHPRTA